MESFNKRATHRVGGLEVLSESQALWVGRVLLASALQGNFKVSVTIASICFLSLTLLKFVVYTNLIPVSMTSAAMEAAFFGREQELTLLQDACM